MSDMPDPIPAATLVLMRERSGGPPELLMTERTGQMVFAAGALVFPGGRIDPADHDAARAFPELPDAAARIAAVRETIEETGLAPALVPPPRSDVVDRLRSALVRETSLSHLLDVHGLRLDLDALTPFARWCPNFKETRRFDTLFFLAEAPPDGPVPQVAEEEAVRALWASAADILAEIAAGHAHAIFPTRRNLERLARFGSIAEARADAVRHPVQKVVPWVEDRDGVPWLRIPDGIGYPVTAELLETARRM